ncbi:MAG: hypothetical protein WAT93_05005 [Pontixanthobacter sp.]
MSAIVLGILFATAAVVAAVSLFDSALRGTQAYRELSRAVKLQNSVQTVRVQLGIISKPVRLTSAETYCFQQARQQRSLGAMPSDQLRVAA